MDTFAARYNGASHNESILHSCRCHQHFWIVLLSNTSRNGRLKAFPMSLLIQQESKGQSLAPQCSARKCCFVL